MLKTDIRLKALLFTMLFIIVGNSLYAAHIIGGDVTYKFLGREGDNAVYLITFTMYRDSKSNGAPFDNDAQFGIYIKTNTGWNFVKKTSPLNPKFKEAVDPEQSNPCVIVPSNIGVERGVYEFEVMLPVSDNIYKIAYQRCCRNETITNIIDPGETGALFSIDITSEALNSVDNSPVFNEFPPIVICEGRDINFDHSATDADGDQLIYEFCAPISAGGTAGGSSSTPGLPTDCNGVKPDPEKCKPPFDVITFNAPTYTYDKPMAGNPTVKIDPNTGIISGVPTNVGQYVVGVCAKEYRNGILIGEIRRDFQFNVIRCENKVNALLDADFDIAINKYRVDLCGEKNLLLNNTSGEAKFIDSYQWERYDVNDTILYNTKNLNISFDDYGSYNFRMFLNRDIVGNTDCSDSVDLLVNVFPGLSSDFVFDYDTCVAGPVFFQDASFAEVGIIKNYLWNFNLDGNSNFKDPTFTFETPGDKLISLEITDINGCKDLTSKVISYNPVPALLVVDPSQFKGCTPAEIKFNNLSVPIDSTYDVNWDFGDGGMINEVSPSHTFEEPGIYTIKLHVTSPIGCETSRDFNDWIEILPGPIADFTYSPEQPNILQNEVSFYDQSQEAIAWQWNFNDERVDFIQNPSYSFIDTGLVYVSLLVKHESGCTDTLTKLIDILPLNTLQFPNAFTPNGDGLNDDFLGVGYLEGIKAYQLSIWNRWGEKIFESQDPSVGWNGRKNNSGGESPQDTYIFIATYTGPRGNIEEFKGNVTLIR